MPKWLILILALVSVNGFAAEAQLQIIADGQRLSFTRAQLLSRPDLETVSITGSEYKEAKTQFRAVPIANLFRGIAVPEDAAVQFRCTDGFAAYLEKARLFNRDANASKAYLAIEDPKRPWPRIPGKKTSAGPFYLVWENPEASSIGPEEWPYQVISFEILSDLHAVFPNIFPASNAGSNIENGFKVFKRNCFTCHQINGEGAGIIGPDLNRPLSPVEYFEPDRLKQLIRDSASVRNWPHRLMPAFSTEALPDTDLADLMVYLHHMSMRKRRD